jgi:hypothetical protein
MQSHRLVKYKIHTGSNFIKTVFDIYLGFQVIGCRTIEIMVVFQAGNDWKRHIVRLLQTAPCFFCKSKGDLLFCTWGRKSPLGPSVSKPLGEIIKFPNPRNCGRPSPVYNTRWPTNENYALFRRFDIFSFSCSSSLQSLSFLRFSIGHMLTWLSSPLRLVHCTCNIKNPGTFHQRPTLPLVSSSQIDLRTIEVSMSRQFVQRR